VSGLACDKSVSDHNSLRTDANASENVVPFFPGHDTPPKRFPVGNAANNNATTE